MSTSDPSATEQAVDLTVLAEAILASRGIWAWDDMVDAVAATVYRLIRRGVRVTHDGVPISRNLSHRVLVRLVNKAVPVPPELKAAP